MHLPSEPCSAQASHWPLQGVLQQTPSTQWPFWHSWSEAQELESANLFSHLPTPSQKATSLVQSLSAAQSAAHTSPEHRNGAHGVPGLSAQVPCPSHSLPT